MEDPPRCLRVSFEVDDSQTLIKSELQWCTESFSDSSEDSDPGGDAEVDTNQVTFNTRLIKRSSPYHQCGGGWNVTRQSEKTKNQTKILRHKDFFRTLLSMAKGKLVAIVVFTIISTWLILALFFWLISDRCGLDADTYLKALFLAIETAETIGYGVPDQYYRDCYSGVVILGASMLVSTLLSASLFSLVYTRVSRSTGRATTIVYTDKAIIAKHAASWQFMFRVCDFRKHQLLEANVRLYSVQHETTAHCAAFRSCQMRTQHPDDEFGAMLLLLLPQMVKHCIDAQSPLCPPQYRDEDADLDRLTSAEILEHIKEAQIEVLCLVEGVEPTTSNTLQARHSYTVDDVVFDAEFRSCVHRLPDGKCAIDLDRFHHRDKKR